MNLEKKILCKKLLNFHKKKTDSISDQLIISILTNKPWVIVQEIYLIGQQIKNYSAA